ncbi:MAG TPA: 2-iminoacetate synthase ThiH, partial [bacterium]|nr:2-iminoacetate synthase ThiH [bacterium]
AKAGIKELTLGILLGLYDWRIDSVFLAQHAKYLIKKYWRSHINISFPRIRPSVSDFQPRYPVSDKNLAQLIIALRIVFQDAGLNLSTREPAALRDNLVNLGITHLSAGSKTNPGGYNINDRTEEQFKISDERSPYEIADTLKSKNIDVVWKDWDKYLKI